MKDKVWALVLAGGRGERFGAFKQKHRLGPKTVLEHSLGLFEEHPLVDGIVLVIAGELLPWARSLADKYGKLKEVLKGGKNRQESSRIGVFALKEDGIVLIHDAARPNPSRSLVDRVIEGAEKWGAAVPVIAVTDSIARVEGGFLREHVSRKGLFRIQTPQGFKISLIKEAHHRMEGGDFPDDSSLFIAAAMGKVKAVEGEITNIKITYPSDLQFLRSIL